MENNIKNKILNIAFENNITYEINYIDILANRITQLSDNIINFKQKKNY